MNFGSFTTRGHSPITWTFTPHSYRSLIDCISHHPLHQHSCSQWSRLHLFTISQSPSPNHTHTHTHTLLKLWTFSYSLPSIVSPATLQSVLSIVLVGIPVCDSCLCSWFILSALPSGYCRRSSTHACPWIILCPVFVIPVCYCPTLPVLTMSYNKSLQMDPHVSRLVSSVTDTSLWLADYISDLAAYISGVPKLSSGGRSSYVAYYIWDDLKDSRSSNPDNWSLANLVLQTILRIWLKYLD